MSITESRRPKTVQVITSVQRRRRYAAHEKHAIVLETLQTGQSVSAVARKSSIAPSQLYQWRKSMKEGARVGVSADDGVVSKEGLKKIQERTRRLERLLGIKTRKSSASKMQFELDAKKPISRAPLLGVEDFE